MEYKICPICNNHAEVAVVKKSVEYFQCSSCKTLFCGELDNDNKVGGGFEYERNTIQNHIRIERIEKINRSLGVPIKELNILDFGCGNFMLGSDLIDAGYNCDGYDLYNEKYQKLPEQNKYHIITAIEVIEHTSAPYVEIDVMYRSLTNYGVVMIETSFVDVAIQDKISFEDYFYIDPEPGHSTIFSHHSLDLIMALKGFVPQEHFDRHVRIYQKIEK